ncbi:MAG: STAS domain-containing protein [Pseudonocardia sp.]|nr:STAS domain-containing protein [Pseudonocardia sp.]
MTASQKRAQRGVNPGVVSLVSINASPGVEGVVERETVVNDDLARRRADNLNAEAQQTVTIARGGAEYAYITLRGHPDHHGGQRLRTQLGAVLDTGARYLTVDLSGLSCCDEIMLDVLDWAARRACSQKGWLALTGGHHHIRFTAR